MRELSIENETENGSATIDGYICGIQQVNVFNFLSSISCEDSAKKIIDYLTQKDAEEISIIKGVYVPEEERNKGYGNYLIESFLNEVSETSFVLLECDTGESNNFSLKEWYQDFGFESFSNIGKLKDLDGIEDLMFLRME